MGKSHYTDNITEKLNQVENYTSYP